MKPDKDIALLNRQDLFKYQMTKKLKVICSYNLRNHFLDRL